MFRHRLVLAFVMSILTVTYVPAQNTSKPLSNEDVVSMVKAGLPSSTITGAIQSQDTAFDLSAAGLISLKKSGVSQPIMDAMLAAATKKREAAAAAPPAPATAQPVPSPVNVAPSQPTVYLKEADKKQALPLSHAQISQTKTKPSSLGALRYTRLPRIRSWHGIRF